MPWLPDLVRSLTHTRAGLREPAAAGVAELAQPPEPPEAAAECPPVIEDEYADRRSSPRYEAEVDGRLQLPTSEHDCRILDLSTGGMSGTAADAALVPGMQVAVLAQNLPALVGTVCWNRPDGGFGVQFSQPISPKVIEAIGHLKRRIRTPRASRATTRLPCVVWFDGLRYPVMVSNISVGGMLMIDPQPPLRGERRLIRRGQALMIHFPDMLPIGGHVRWTLGARIGVMFTRLLPMSMAEEIQRIGGLPIGWLDDVEQAHLGPAA